MAIQLLSNLNYPIGNIVSQELQNANSAKIAVAFLKYSGLKVIEQSLNHCLKNKGNSVKFTDSIFSPDEEYLAGYSDIYKVFLQNEEKASKDKDLKKIVNQIRKREEFLPGTVPSLKSLIIDIIRQKNKEGLEFVPLQTIYEEAKKIVSAKNLKYKMDTFHNSIRGELNKHEVGSKHPDRMSLFIRSSERKGYYSLTNKGKKYEGR